MDGIGTTIGLGGLWLLREVVGAAIGRAAARHGRVGYVSERAELVERARDANGELRDFFFLPDTPASDTQFAVAKHTGHIYNDSSTGLVLRKPAVTSWNANGPALTYSNPTCRVNGEESVLVSVPANGSCRLDLEFNIPKDRAAAVYIGSIPVLSLILPDERVMEFALVGSAIDRNGDVLGWDNRHRRAVAAGSPEWMRARLKGALGSQAGAIRSSRP
jgi:hypothetical protein